MIVLDTHARFWLVACPEHLSDAGAIAVDESDEIGMSAIACWDAVEIGAALGLVPDTVATHLRRARAAFSKALQKRGR